MMHGEFAEIVAPLEEAGGEPLENGGRVLCFREWRRDPEGFRRLADRALAEGRMPVCALVHWLPKDRPAAPREPAGRAARKSSSDECRSCGSVPLEKDERLIIVRREIGKALCSPDRICSFCNEKLKPGRKGTVGELVRSQVGTEYDQFTDTTEYVYEYRIEWCHAKCLREYRAEADASENGS
jgi:hypothetical protein